MKQYRLLNDLPGLKAGAIFQGDFYYHPKYYNNYLILLDHTIVENNPSWFEEIINYNSTLLAVKDGESYPVIQLDYRDNIALIFDGTTERKIALSDVDLKIKL